jgi:DNA-binding response OmpR family regulator
VLKLLIADASEPYTEALEAVFKNECDLRICYDGESALEMLLSFRPDVLAINLSLPFKDGFTVLQESAYRPEMILAVTHLRSPYVEHTAAELGVQYLMVSPSIKSLRVRLMDMLNSMDTQKKDLYSQTAIQLHILNFRTHLDGYHQLRVGIPMFFDNPDISLSKELYPAIAAHFQLSDFRTVEHSMRHAIVDAWHHKDPIVWAGYFPPGADGKIPCPTNKNFFAAIAEKLVP